MMRKTEQLPLFVYLIIHYLRSFLLCSSFSLNTQSIIKRSHFKTVVIYAKGSRPWKPTDSWDELSNEERDENQLNPFTQPIPKVYQSNFTSFLDNVTEEEENQFIEESIDTILMESYGEPSDLPLFDTRKSLEKYLASDQFFEHAADEISFLVRCNDSPEEMLIGEGRAVKPLTDEERFNVTQLVYEECDREEEHQQINEKVFKATSFFNNSIFEMFDRYSILETSTHEYVMGAKELASWMTTCLNNDKEGEQTKINKHDKRIALVISKYSSYKTGRLNKNQFYRIYWEAVMTDVVHNMNGGNNTPKKFHRGFSYSQPGLDSVWRDLKAHGILSPKEVEHKRQIEILKKSLDVKEKLYGDGDDDLIMDECEILHWGGGSSPKERNENRNSFKSKTKSSSSYSSDNYHVDTASHKKVELASDDRTPKRMRDGNFVIIDEETCIGCTQCVQCAPSVFRMLDNGRARAFQQSTALDIVSEAILSCPVDCIHQVSFDELKDIETLRDQGDGRTDHRQLMSQQQIHTPLHVARRGTDANHKSSWYHHYRHKCFTSKSCPQKGCYDCPMYNTKGMNPYFIKKQRIATHIRATDLINSGEADRFRKFADL